MRTATIALCALLLTACGSSGDATRAVSSAPGTVTPTASSASVSPSGPITTTSWVVNETVDPSVATGLQISIEYPAAASVNADVTAAQAALKTGGMSGTWLVAQVVNDSGETASVTDATVVTTDRKQVKLDSGLLLLNELGSKYPAKYTDAVSALNGKLADQQGSNILTGTDATVILGTFEPVTGVAALYVSVNGRDIQALPPGAVPAVSDSPSEVAPTGEAAPPAAGLVPDGATAKQVADALGCTGYAKKVASKATSSAFGPPPVQEGYCKLAGTKFTVTTYATPAETTAIVALVKAFAKGFKMKFEVGVGSTWVIAASSSKATTLGSPMTAAVTMAGGEVVSVP